MIAPLLASSLGNQPLIGEGWGEYSPVPGQKVTEGGASWGSGSAFFVRMSGATQSGGFESNPHLYSLLFPQVAESLRKGRIVCKGPWMRPGILLRSIVAKSCLLP